MRALFTAVPTSAAQEAEEQGGERTNVTPSVLRSRGSGGLVAGWVWAVIWRHPQKSWKYTTGAVSDVRCPRAQGASQNGPDLWGGSPRAAPACAES